MKISLRLVGCAVGFVALALTGALAQSPAAFSFQLVTKFDYPGTVTQTQPQKINDLGDIAGIFVDTSAVSRAFIRFSNGHFSPPIVDPNDAGNTTQGRGINNSRLVCGDYIDSGGAFEGFFFSHPTFTNYDPDPTFTIVLGVNNVGDFSGSDIPTGGTQEAFLNIGGTVTEFSVAGATGTILFGNNDRNFMVGRYTDATGATHGILFVPPNRFLVYDQPGATFTSLNGINRGNMICGRYTDPSTGIDHGIIVQVVRTASGGVMLPLAPPAPPAPAAP